MDVSLPRQNREHLPLTHTEPLGNLADRHTVRVLPLDFLVAPEPLKRRRLGDEQPLPAEGCCQRARLVQAEHVRDGVGDVRHRRRHVEPAPAPPPSEGHGAVHADELGNLAQ